MKHSILVAGIASLVALPALGAVGHRLPSPRETESAVRYVIYDLALLKSPLVRREREHCRSYCGDEGSTIEVTTGLIGAGGHATTQSLLKLLSVRLDAGGAEERECQIAKRGKALIPALKQFNASQASGWCHQTFHDLRKQELASINDVSAEEICRPPAEIEADRKEWLAALKSGRDLFAESGPC